MLKKLLIPVLSISMLFSMVVAVNPGAMVTQAKTISLNPTHRYILTDVNKTIPLSSISISPDGTTTVPGNVVTWTPGDSGVTVSNGVLTATSKGPHKVTLSAGTITGDIYVVAKESAESQYILYSENFDNLADGSMPAGWTRTQGKTAANAAVSGKRFVIDATSTDNPSRVKLPDYLDSFGDYTVSADATILKANDSRRWISVMYRVKNDGVNYYPYFQMCVRQADKTGDGIEFAECTPTNSWKYNTTDKVPTIEALDPAKMYNLKITIKGSHVDEYFNDKLALSTDDGADLQTGGVGLQANGCQAAFDNIVVTLPAPTSYNVTADHPYILADTNQSIALENINISPDASTTVTGDTVTWTPADNGLTVGSGALTATQKGPHKVTISAGTISKDIYIFAKDPAEKQYVLYSENFDSVADGTMPAGWIRSQGKTAANAAVNGKRFVIDASSDPDNPSRVKLPDYLDCFGDYTVSADATMLKANNNRRWLSVMFRVKNDGVNYYPYFHMCVRQADTTGDGVEFAECTPTNSWKYNTTDIAPTVEAFDPAKMYNLKITIKGSHVDEYFNDKLALSTDDGVDLQTGGVGLQANGCQAAFDNILVTIPATSTSGGDSSSSTAPSSSIPSSSSEVSSSSTPSSSSTVSSSSAPSSSSEASSSSASSSSSEVSSSSETPSSSEVSSSEPESSAPSTSSEPTTSKPGTNPHTGDRGIALCISALLGASLIMVLKKMK